MKIRALDSNKDWSFGKGLSFYAIDQKAINQNIETRLLEWKNDCFFQLKAGVDWRNRLGGKSVVLLNAELRNVLIQTDGVLEIIELSSDIVNRSLKISYNVKTVFASSAQAIINRNL